MLVLDAQMAGSQVKRSSLEEQMGSIAEKQQYWKSQLQPIVDKINVVFGKHMEVEIHRSEYCVELCFAETQVRWNRGVGIP